MQRHSQQGGVWRRAQPNRCAASRCQRALYCHALRKFRVVRDTDVGQSNQEQGDDARPQQPWGRALPVAAGYCRMSSTGPGGLADYEAASEMSRRAASIRQLGTHRKLVSRTEQRELETRLTLDAIIVPASRPARNLEQAITLARAMNCALLILCSHQVKPHEVHQLLAERTFSGAIVVDLPDGYRHELLDFRALASIKDELPDACSWYVTDLSAKRNVGLILARMLGWRRIFFLDDDIRDINPLDVQSTVSMLKSFPAAGMRVSSFPDIYNEDWLFFYDAASAGRLGGSELRVTQLRYDPFADPDRAAWQEFGDVLAEGLYALLDQGLDWRYATDGYWSQFLEARRGFLEAILGRAETMNSG